MVTFHNRLVAIEGNPHEVRESARSTKRTPGNAEMSHEPSENRNEAGMKSRGENSADRASKLRISSDKNPGRETVRTSVSSSTVFVRNRRLASRPVAASHVHRDGPHHLRHGLEVHQGPETSTVSFERRHGAGVARALSAAGPVCQSSRKPYFGRRTPACPRQVT